MISGYGSLTKPKPGAMINPLHPLSSGLVGYWLFNEGSGSRAYDISGYGNHGTLKNMFPNAQDSGWGGSKFGGGLEFDGNNGYVVCSANDLLKIYTSGTISAWVNIDTPISGTWRVFVSKWTSAYNYWLGLNSANRFYISFDGVGAPDAASLNVATTGWHHVVGVADADAGEVILYLDGVFQNKAVYDGVCPTAATPLYFGCTNATSYHVKCSIDNICMYNRALSATEVKTLYHNPFCNLLRVLVSRWYAPPAVGNPMWYYDLLRRRNR